MDIMFWLNLIYTLFMISGLMMSLIISPFIISHGNFKAFYMMFIDLMIIAYITLTYVNDTTEMVKLNIPFVILTIALIQMIIISIIHADKLPINMECCK